MASSYCFRIQRADGATAVLKGIRDANRGDFWMDLHDWSPQLHRTMKIWNIRDAGRTMIPGEGEPLFADPAQAVAWFAEGSQ